MKFNVSSIFGREETRGKDLNFNLLFMLELKITDYLIVHLQQHGMAHVYIHPPEKVQGKFEYCFTAHIIFT